MTMMDAHPDFDAILRVLGVESPDAAGAEILRHLETCQRCSTLVAEWQGLTDTEAATDLDALTRRLIARARLAGSRAGLPVRRRHWGSLPAAAALATGLVVGGALAFALGSQPPKPSSSSPASPTPATHLLFLGKPDPQNAFPLEAYATWSADLRARGQLLSAEVLSDEELYVGPPDERLEALAAALEEAATGYYLLRVPDDEAARELAAASPAALAGAGVLILRIFPTGRVDDPPPGG